MPLPEGYLPREGDEVLIRARLKHGLDDDGEGYFEIVGKEHNKFFMDADKIHGLYRRQWNEGDKVRSIEFGWQGRVLATSEVWVWVEVETGPDAYRKYTFAANELEPWVDQEEIVD